MAKVSVTELQEKLDVTKWTDSEAKGVDTCGEYDYCKYCNKAEENPCANAFMKADAKEEKPVVAKKPSAKKSTEKKTTEKKTTAKKSTTKKSATKK